MQFRTLSSTAFTQTPPHTPPHTPPSTPRRPAARLNAHEPAAQTNRPEAQHAVPHSPVDPWDREGIDQLSHSNWVRENKFINRYITREFRQAVVQDNVHWLNELLDGQVFTPF